MQLDDTTIRRLLSHDLTDVMIRIGLIALVVVLCVRIFAPFLGVMLWALILAVALYPLHQRLAAWLRGRQGPAATLLILIGLLLIGAPTVMLGGSFAGYVQDTFTAIETGSISISEPSPAIADWPLVGKEIHAAWSAAAADLPQFVREHREQIEGLSKRAISAAASTLGSVLLFLVSLIIAGIMMAYGESGSMAMRRILSRLTGPAKGPRLHRLSTATIRSVATGVIGVAFIQALLLGSGFVLAGIPAAGVLAVIVLLLGIAQLPAALVFLPAIAWLWMSGDGSTTSNIVFTAYLVLAGLADNVLKPLLLGRGVDAPMPVVLLGAIGGMVSAGIIGLFIGAVVLAIGYQVFMEWVNEAETTTGGGSQEAEPVAPTPPPGG